MKSEVKEKKGHEFPKLMISDDMILLVTDSHNDKYFTGVLLTGKQTGKYYEFWDSKFFKDFKGEITLSND